MQPRHVWLCRSTCGNQRYRWMLPAPPGLSAGFPAGSNFAIRLPNCGACPGPNSRQGTRQRMPGKHNLCKRAGKASAQQARFVHASRESNKRDTLEFEQRRAKTTQAKAISSPGDAPSHDVPFAPRPSSPLLPARSFRPPLFFGASQQPYARPLLALAATSPPFRQPWATGSQHAQGLSTRPQT